MKFSKIVILSALAMTLMFGISGCEKTSPNLTYEFFSNSNTSDKDYDICVYNSHCEYEEMFSTIVKQYENETGVKVKVISSTSYENAEDRLQSQKAKTANFALFSVNGLAELNALEKYAKICELSSLDNAELKNIIDHIPSKFHLTTNQTDNYGIPICLTAKSYFVDKTLIEDLVGKNQSQAFLSDLSEAPYQDFLQFVTEADKYFQDKTYSPISVNKHTYNFQEKSDRIKKITHTFSETLLNETINAFLSTSFQSEHDVLSATKDKIASLPFSQLVDVLKLQYSSTVQNSTSKESFIKSAYDVLSSDSNINIFPIPIKLPYNKSSNNLSSLNTSICIASNGYFVFNGKSSPKEKKLAQNFILWLHNNNTTPLCKFDKTAFAKETTEKYDKDKKTFRETVYGLPVGLTSYISQHNFEDDTEKISEYIKSKWSDLI